jgi:hypothetical protein
MRTAMRQYGRAFGLLCAVRAMRQSGWGSPSAAWLKRGRWRSVQKASEPRCMRKTSPSPRRYFCWPQPFRRAPDRVIQVQQATGSLCVVHAAARRRQGQPTASESDVSESPARCPADNTASARPPLPPASRLRNA